MSLTTTGRNNALDGIPITHVSLHSAFPGSTGSNELSGSGYARVSVVFSAASGGVRNLSAPAALTVGSGHTVRWAGLWNGTTFIGYSPNNGSPREFQVDVLNDLVSVPAHGYADDDAVVLYGGTVPGGVTEGQIYYVIDATTDTFKLSATVGGAAIDLTSTSAPDCVISRITQSAYGGADTHTINTWGLGLVF